MYVCMYGWLVGWLVETPFFFGRYQSVNLFPFRNDGDIPFIRGVFDFPLPSCPWLMGWKKGKKKKKKKKGRKEKNIPR